MSEHRTLQRWHLILYLRVFDRDSMHVIGHVVDLNTDGLMLVSDKPLPVGKEYRLMMEIPQDDGAKKALNFSATSLWCKPDINPDFFDTGFKLVEADAEISQTIRLLVDDLKFDE